MYRSRPVLSMLGVLALLALPVLGLSACGDSEKEPGATTPYGQGTPYGANTPYGAGGGGETSGLPADLAKRVGEALAKGRELLISVQDESGGWGDPALQMPANGGYTAMAGTAVIGATPPMEVKGDAAIRKALDFLAGLQKDDGSIWDNPAFRNYITSAAVGTFATAKIPAYREVEAKGREFLAESQITGDEADPSYGGFPYKQDQGQPADLSNVQFALQALADAGLPPDHPVWKRALVYLSRVQNRSEGSDYTTEVEIDGEAKTVKLGDDGGAFYHPGNSKAGYVDRPDGTVEPASYGSMTYALLKCLLLAGADPEDARVLAALGWISEHFTLDRNPGFESAVDAEKAGQQGWYYYVFTMARTLAQYEAVTEEPLVVKDAEGREHDWRREIARAVLDRQGEDGWWVNEVAERWEEGSKVLATSYALQALAEVSGRLR